MYRKLWGRVGPPSSSHLSLTLVWTCWHSGTEPWHGTHLETLRGFLVSTVTCHECFTAAAVAVGPEHLEELTLIQTSVLYCLGSLENVFSLWVCIFSCRPGAPWLTHRCSWGGTGDTRDWHLQISRSGCRSLPRLQQGRSWRSEGRQCSGHTSHSCLVPAPRQKNHFINQIFFYVSFRMK